MLRILKRIMSRHAHHRKARTSRAEHAFHVGHAPAALEAKVRVLLQRRDVPCPLAHGDVFQFGESLRETDTAINHFVRSLRCRPCAGPADELDSRCAFRVVFTTAGDGKKVQLDFITLALEDFMQKFIKIMPSCFLFPAAATRPQH